MIQTQHIKPVVKNKRIEFKLILFFAYVGSLIYLLIKGYPWMSVAWVHVCFVFIYSIYAFGRDFTEILFAPFVAIMMPITHWQSMRYLKKFKQNIHAEAVIILGHSDWHKLKGWIQPNYFPSELKAVVSFLKSRKRAFSFYPKANAADIEDIMKNNAVKEVILLGHGDSHVFQLCTDELLYYCEFKGGEYMKEFVHQLHCGTRHGKSLIDYVVPEANRANCFLIRKPITGPEIEKELKRRMKDSNVRLPQILPMK